MIRLIVLLLLLFPTSVLAQKVGDTVQIPSVSFGQTVGNEIKVLGTLPAGQYKVLYEKPGFIFLSGGKRYGQGWVFKSVAKIAQKKITPKLAPGQSTLKGGEAWMQRVLDGDTLQVQTNKGLLKIRLEGIDAPESSQAYGFEATRQLRQLTTGRILTVQGAKKDRYGRTLATVWVGTKNINKTLLESGLAWHYKKYSKSSELARAENKAKSNRQGLWRQAKRVAPWDYRNGVRVATVKPINAPSIRTIDKQVFVTQYGHKYHRPGCKHLRKSQIPISLSRARSAYGPCRNCNPPR